MKSIQNMEPHKLTVSDDLSEHIAWVYENIYRHDYHDNILPDYQNNDKVPPALRKVHKILISRPMHGIQHVSRVAFYVPIFVNLYRRFQHVNNDPEILRLNNGDIKLLQIAALFHDAGRKGDKEDKPEWEQQGGTMLFNYLTQTLKVLEEKAKLLAEAIVNKDSTEFYYSFENGNWKKGPKKPKNIYQKIIQNADCLDIKRARPAFDASYLDFYKDIASKDKNAFEEMAHLIIEARSLIHINGDSYCDINKNIKLEFDNGNYYQKFFSDIFDPKRNPNAAQYTIVRHCYSGAKILPAIDLKKPILESLTLKDDLKELTNEKLAQLLWNGKVLARGLSSVSAIHKKTGRPDETLAGFDIRKTLRRKGFATRTKKADAKEKHGFLFRSTSLLGPNSGLFTSAGFLILNPDNNRVKAALAENASTGFGKKKKLKIGTDKDKNPLKDYKTLDNLLEQLKMGGKAKNFLENHTEVVYDIVHANAVFFTRDPTKINYFLNKNLPSVPSNEKAYSFYTDTPLLEAIYLQREYQLQTNKVDPGIKSQLPLIDLPIIEYSYVHHTLKLIPTLSHSDIKNIWLKMCKAYLIKQWKSVTWVNSAKKDFLSDVFNENLTNVKLKMAYGTIKPLDRESLSLDTNYDEKLQNEINDSIKNEIQDFILENYFSDHIKLELIPSGFFKTTYLENAFSIIVKDSENFLSLPLKMVKLYDLVKLCKFDSLKNKIHKFIEDKYLNVLKDEKDYSTKLFIEWNEFIKEEKLEFPAEFNQKKSKILTENFANRILSIKDDCYQDLLKEIIKIEKLRSLNIFQGEVLQIPEILVKFNKIFIPEIVNTLDQSYFQHYLKVLSQLNLYHKDLVISEIAMNRYIKNLLYTSKVDEKLSNIIIKNIDQKDNKISKYITIRDKIYSHRNTFSSLPSNELLIFSEEASKTIFELINNQRILDLINLLINLPSIKLLNETCVEMLKLSKNTLTEIFINLGKSAEKETSTDILNSTFNLFTTQSNALFDLLSEDPKETYILKISYAFDQNSPLKASYPSFITQLSEYRASFFGNKTDDKNANQNNQEPKFKK